MAADELELLRLEADFTASCRAVYASSAQLHKLHSFLVGELLSLEADKRHTLAQRIREMEVQVASMKVSLTNMVACA